MNEQKRPTSITVIGWVWQVIGALMCFSAIIALGLTGGVEQSGSGGLLLVLLVQLGFGIVGGISGMMFLRLKAWARRILTGLTSVLFLFAVGSMIIWFVMWGLMIVRSGPTGFHILGGIMGLAIAGVYILPLWLMLKHLRCAEVKNAMKQR